MLDCAPSLSSLNSFASAELKILPEIAHRARRGKDGKGQEGQEEDVSLETEYASQTLSDEQDEDETPPQEGLPTVTVTTRPEKGKEKIPSPGT